MNQLQKLRQIIYDRICYEQYISSETFSPDIIINNGRYEFYGIHAESLIYDCANDINLPNEFLEKFFPYNLYFFLETPFTGFVLLIRFLKKLLNKYLNLNLKIRQKQPITIKQFADIMIDLWEQYQKENKK